MIDSKPVNEVEPMSLKNYKFNDDDLKYSHEFDEFAVFEHSVETSKRSGFYHDEPFTLTKDDAIAIAKHFKII